LEWVAFMIVRQDECGSLFKAGLPPDSVADEVPATSPPRV
jgi:hypothetical protein